MKSLTALLTLGLLSWSQAEAAAPYYRFWRGNKLPTLTLEQFKAGLNENFIQETVEQGKGKGLLSYQPVLLPKDHPGTVHDEIALVTYESEAKYREIRSTPRGQAYAELHWKYFDKSTSQSLVPSPYAGSVEFDRAYDVLTQDVDWDRGNSYVSVQTRKPGVSDAAYLSTVRDYLNSIQSGFPKKGLKAYLVLVSGQHLVQYSLWESKEARKAAWISEKGTHLLQILATVTSGVMDKPTVRGRTQIDFGQGTHLSGSSSQISAQMIAGTIDHTFLKTEAEGISYDDQKANVAKIVHEAHNYGAFAVCVRESMVSHAKALLKGLNSRVKIVSVIGFPNGDQFSTEEKVRLLEFARRDGADEFDMVIRVQALKNRDYQSVYQDVLKVSRAAGKDVLKVIFENAYLDEFEKRASYSIVMQALIDSFDGDRSMLRRRFLKTSTGFAEPPAGVAVGATLPDVQLMHAIGTEAVGIKPAGGVNDLAQAIDFFRAAGSPTTPDGQIDPYRFRIGTSSLLGKLFEGGGSGDY